MLRKRRPRCFATPYLRPRGYLETTDRFAIRRHCQRSEPCVVEGQGFAVDPRTTGALRPTMAASGQDGCGALVPRRRRRPYLCLSVDTEQAAPPVLALPDRRPGDHRSTRAPWCARGTGDQSGVGPPLGPDPHRHAGPASAAWGTQVLRHRCGRRVSSRRALGGQRLATPTWTSTSRWAAAGAALPTSTSGQSPLRWSRTEPMPSLSETSCRRGVHHCAQRQARHDAQLTSARRRRRLRDHEVGDARL